MITDQDLFVKLAKGRQRTLARIEALPESERGAKAGLIPILRAAKPIERIRPDLPVYTPRMGNPDGELVEARRKWEYFESRLFSDRQLWDAANRGDITGEQMQYYTPKQIKLVQNRNYWMRKVKELEARGGNPLVFRTSRGEMTEADIMERAREAAERREIPPDYRQASTAARWLDAAGVIKVEGARLMREKNPPMLVLGNPGSTKGSYPFAQKEEQYRGYTDEMLHYAKLDANKAAQAMRGHDAEAEAWYMDDISTIWKEMNRRHGPRSRHGNPPLLVLGNPKSGPADSTAAEELELFITNDADLYRQQFWPIVKNLMHRQMKGDFDFEKSVKLWGYFVDNGAKKYIKEHGSPGQKIDSMFNKNTRLIVARSLANSFVTEAEYGNYDIPAEGLRWGLERGGNPQIHAMDDSSWKKATKAQKIHWLQNVIAYRKATTRPGVPDSMGFYWLKKYGKRLASLQRKKNPELGEFCPQCGGDPTFIGQLGNQEAFRCRQCGWEWLVKEGGRGIERKWPKRTPMKKVVKRKSNFDPNAALRDISDFLESRESGDEVDYMVEDLFRWIQRGGFEPDWKKYPLGASYYNSRVAGAKRRGVNSKKLKNPVKKVKRGKNPSELPAHIANDPAFKKELAAFHKRHGNIPVRVKTVSVPNGFPKYMSAYGEAPEAKYDAPKGSKKGKRFHVFGKKGKGRPNLVSSVEKGPKFLAYVGGKFKAKTDWLYD